MPVQLYETAHAWTQAIIEHCVVTGHTQLLSSDEVGYAYGVACVQHVDDHTWRIPREALRRDRSRQGRALAAEIATTSGRAGILRVLLEAAKLRQKPVEPKTAWERLLAPDDD
jgi:hypothetical protein